MTTISFTLPVANSTLNSIADPEIVTAFQTIQTWANGNIDGANVSATLTGRRLIGQAVTWFGSAQGAAADFFVRPAGGPLQSGTSITDGCTWWYLDPALFAVAGKANTQAVLRMSVAVNGTAPAASFTGKLAPVTFGGTLGSSSFTSGSAVASSTATVTTPGAGAVVVQESGTFTFPAAGAYAPVIALSGATATSSATSIVVQLFALNS